MYKNKSIIAIIPARKNSKGLYKKNILKIKKKELFLWPLSTIKKSKYVDKVVVSTDDISIYNKSIKNGAHQFILRPKNISGDKSKTSSAILHALNYFKKNKNKSFDYVICLEPTSPFTDIKFIDKSIKKLISNPVAYSLVSVYSNAYANPNSLFTTNKKKNFLILPKYKNLENFHTRRQDLKKYYFLDGSLYLSKVSSFFRFKSFLTKKTMWTLTRKKIQAMEIDDKDDYNFLKLIIENGYK